jgi:hypothetical protein
MRLRAAGAAVPRKKARGGEADASIPRSSLKPLTKMARPGSFSLTSQDDIVTKDDDDDEEEDPEKRTAVPRARQRAAKAHLPTKPKLYSERWSARRPTRGPEARRDDRHQLAAAARAGIDIRSNKD